MIKVFNNLVRKNDYNIVKATYVNFSANIRISGKGRIIPLRSATKKQC